MTHATPGSPRPPEKTPEPSFFQRLPIAIGAFFSILSNPTLAARFVDLQRGPVAAPAPAPAPAPVVAAPAPVPVKAPNHDAALQLLSLLQREARLIDFTQEDLSSYSDADVGGAARVVHEGCCKVLREHFSIAPVRPETEGSRITLASGFDARAVRLTGNVVGSAPFSGSLSHRGWRATEVRLPTLAEQHDATVLAQAEVEL
jgi:hypothetical protein